MTEENGPPPPGAVNHIRIPAEDVPVNDPDQGPAAPGKPVAQEAGRLTMHGENITVTASDEGVLFTSNDGSRLNGATIREFLNTNDVWCALGEFAGN